MYVLHETRASRMKTQRNRGSSPSVFWNWSNRHSHRMGLQNKDGLRVMNGRAALPRCFRQSSLSLLRDMYVPLLQGMGIRSHVRWWPISKKNLRSSKNDLLLFSLLQRCPEAGKWGLIFLLLLFSHGSGATRRGTYPVSQRQQAFTL